MERVVWLCACGLALSFALAISSWGVAENADNKDALYEFQTSSCKNKQPCKEPAEQLIKPLGSTSEMFLRKKNIRVRKAYA